MPYNVTIRPTETREITAEPGDLLAFAERIAAVTPDGFELISSSANAGTAVIRPTETRTVEIDALSDLEAAVPEGWQALSVIAV